MNEGSKSYGGQRTRGRTLFSLATLGVLLTLFTSTALAGTETGEFCCTCPDYANYDAWLAKKAQFCSQDIPKAATNPGPDPVALGSAAASSAVSSAPYGESNPSGSATPAYPLPALLVEAGDDLEGRLILDARSPDEYARGHIPGSRNLYYGNLTSGGGIDLARASAALGNAGVEENDSVVVYGRVDEAAYLFWALEYLGQKNVSILDGGADTWTSEGLTLVDTVQSFNATNHTASLRPWLLVNSSTLSLNFSSDGPEVQVIDSRESFADFGRSHLKGAIQIPAESLYEDGLVKGPEEIEETLVGRGLVKEKVQLLYGPRAPALYWPLRLMGYNATLVEGDWWVKSDWAVSNIH